MQRIYARLCEVKEIEYAEAQDFVAQNHRQGAVTSTTVVKSFGLVHEGALVGVAQFCAPRTEGMARRYTVELLRMAFRGGVRVPGGASKLMAHYRKSHAPADIFTYQDATGEVTEVYTHCGFALVSQARVKRYLVAPGKTLATATRQEALGMAYATRYGPDRILGTSLGVCVNEQGRRLTNEEIFVSHLGWHVEETPGDRVYEWVNPDYTFYTYRVTAASSKKYYYGVSHVKKGGATPAECLAHPYWGSGDPKASHNKFVNWKQKHAGELRKEILNTYTRRMDAYQAEKELIGELWKTDADCLNSTPGGRGYEHNRTKLRKAYCAKHGETAHRGETCLKCVAARTVSQRECSIHGVTTFWGTECAKCQAQERITVKECKLHGRTKHKGNKCYACESGKTNSLGLCEVHGEVAFQGKTCTVCVAQARVSLSLCPVHGMTKHQNLACYLCSKEKRTAKKVCGKHGLTTFLGETCAKCSLASVYVVAECPRHGATKHRKDKCVQCSSEKTAHTRFHENKAKDGCIYC